MKMKITAKDGWSITMEEQLEWQYSNYQMSDIK